jgi:hypothetical protein
MTTKPINLVMFAGTDAADSIGLWVSNGTAADTHEVAGISGAFAGGLFTPSQFSPTSRPSTVWRPSMVSTPLATMAADGTGGGTRMTVERAKIDRVCWPVATNYCHPKARLRRFGVGTRP